MNSDFSDPGVSPATRTKNEGAKIEVAHTNELVPGHANYYEKDGLRTYGDAEDHDHEPPVIEYNLSSFKGKANNPAQMSFARIMSLIAMAFLWTSSQIPVYIFGTRAAYFGCLSFQLSGRLF